MVSDIHVEFDAESEVPFQLPEIERDLLIVAGDLGEGLGGREFLLRELEMLNEKPEFHRVPQRYFALAAMAEGIQLEQGSAVDDLQTLVLLDEELRQSDRFMGLEG